MSVLFVAGVHGVGKTTMCNLVSESTNIPFYTASGLIRGEKEMAILGTSKIVINPSNNQQLLVNAVNKKLLEHSKILLDGHFTLLTEDGLVAIGEEVFKALNVSKVIVIRDEPLKILERLRERDDTHHSNEEIMKHQEFELLQAYLVAKSLRIDCTEITSFSISEMSVQVIEWGNSRT